MDATIVLYPDARIMSSERGAGFVMQKNNKGLAS